MTQSLSDHSQILKSDDELAQVKSEEAPSQEWLQTAAPKDKEVVTFAELNDLMAQCQVKICEHCQLIKTKRCRLQSDGGCASIWDYDID